MKALNLFFVLLFVVVSSTSIFAQELTRDEVDDRYKWNLNDIFTSMEEWETAKAEVKNDISELAEYQGKLGKDAETLYTFLEKYFDTVKDFYRVSYYASFQRDLDLNDSEASKLAQQTQTLGTFFGENTAYINPEIIQIVPETIEEFYKTKPELEKYKMYISDVQRQREHTLTPEEEALMASFGLITGTPSQVYNIFNNAEMPFPTVTLSTGEEVTLTNSAFTRYRAVENREDRAKVFETFFNVFGDFKNTIGANLTGKVKTDFVYAKNRNYKSSLESSLSDNNVPVTVYETLIEQINNSLPTLHRFLDLKKKMLGVDELHYYDLYTPLVEKVDMEFTVEEGEKVILEALEPLGEEYVTTVDKAYNNRWIDYYPTVGKRSGAYSAGGLYDIHPYILTNWNDNYESVSTLAHELGHTMHSYFSNTNQPFVDSRYSIFVAEIASTLNENLLNNYMVANAKSDEEKLYLLGSYLELLRTTIFRQTSFAEFEWEIHKKVEAGEPLTGETLSEIYYDIVKKYYGHDAGHCIVDPYIAYEWAYIPHFVFYTYYVYQYSTSLIYATAFAEKIVEEGAPAVDSYYTILKGGSSLYPIDLIKKAGIDPMSPEAFKLTMAKMNSVMDQMEELLNK